ncbi:MAG TPA: TIGR03936 family radical SAM-associated protein [Candidatus Avanaerovorax faecigallinarum]|nr:TIGR03936 family radical SAM-associated protein [Candidatus Avanaerovorax faecigallinarum]
MNRYAMEFSKTGMIRYTSHLDMLRLFKRTLRKTGVPLAYSQGFNPHPKLGFAQPLSLGYEAKSDYIEFETVTPVDTSELLTKTATAMPEGITVLRCVPVLDNVKSLAAMVVSAEYTIKVPDALYGGMNPEEFTTAFLAQDEIVVKKRRKKDKKLVETDIKDRIEALKPAGDKNLYLKAHCGSASNLSPDLVIDALIMFSGADVKKYDFDVSRDRLIFSGEWEDDF